jgi:Acetyltransferase (GNAT) domain
MATSIGAWALRGYGMWACEKIDDGVFIGSVGIFEPFDGPEPEIAYSLDRSFWRQGFATEAARVARDWLFGHFPFRELPASFDPTIRPQSASRNGLAQFANAHSSCAVPAMNIGCITGPRHTLIAQDKNVSRAAQNRPSLHTSSFPPFTRSGADDWS